MKNNQGNEKNSDNLEKNKDFLRGYQENEIKPEEFTTPEFSDDNFERSEQLNSQDSSKEDFVVRKSSDLQNKTINQNVTNPENSEENNENRELTEIAENSHKASSKEDASKYKKRENKKTSIKEKIANANIKQIFLVIMGAIVVFLAVWGLMDIINSVKEARNPLLTPESATRHLVSSISADNYEEFKKLAEPMKNVDNEKALYDKLKKSLETSKDNLITNFVMIKLENGEQYLCSLYRDDNKGEFVFRSIVEIPADAQGFFAR